MSKSKRTRNGISGFHESKPGKPGDMMAGEVLRQVRWSEESLRRMRSFLDGASWVKLTEEEGGVQNPWSPTHMICSGRRPETRGYRAS